MIVPNLGHLCKILPLLLHRLSETNHPSDWRFYAKYTIKSLVLDQWLQTSAAGVHARHRALGAP